LELKIEIFLLQVPEVHMTAILLFSLMSLLVQNIKQFDLDILNMM